MKRIITLTLFLIMAVIASNAQQNKIDDNKLKDKKQLKKTHRGKHPGHLIRQDEKADGSDKQLMKTHGPGYIHPDSLRDKKKERIRQHFEKVRQNQANEEYSPTKPQQKAKADKRRQDSLIEKQMRERYKKLKAQRMDTREKATESDSCSTEDSLALVAIYNNMNGENWTNQSNWLTDASVKDWWGITVENYRVTEISLANNQLEGSIPTELSDLTNLIRLQLYGNRLKGSIPPEIGNLKNLVFLYLANNQLEGSIPPEIGELTKLEYIELGDNKLTGEIPSELGNLTNLIKLQLASNQLSGTIPPELGNLTNLTSLYLNDNQLEGSVPPEINNLTKLEVLYLYDNKLDKLPDLSGITSLSKCLIFENYFDFGDLETAGISDTINNYTYAPQGLIDQSIDTTDSQVTLTALTNSTNNTYQWFENGDSLINETGDNYTYDQSNSSTYYCKINNSNFPELTLQTPAVGEQIENGVKEKDYNALKAIYNKTEGSNWFNNTNWLTDNPVGNWHGITVDGTRVTSVKLNNNNLTGKFPEETFELDSLKMLIYWNNELTDTIPDKFNQVDKLNYIDLDENEFSGNIPSTIGTLDSLETAWITRNNFSGAFDYSTMQSLEGLYIYSNELKFSDLEDIGIAPGDISSYGYSPQSDLSKPDISVNGGQITLSVNASASDNQYIWYKDKEAIDTTTENTTTVIPEISATYYCKITNKQYPDLILKTKKFTYSLYSITFNVTDENSNAVEGAKVSIDGSSELTTNSNGKATIDTSNGSYDYTVSKDGYNDKSGSFKVAGEALTENVTLSESATNINLAEAGNIEIYPNPASDYIMIESAREIENIKIFNLLGEIVSVENTVTEKIRMNIDGLQQGVYMMKIKFSNGETGTQKLMIR